MVIVSWELGKSAGSLHLVHYIHEIRELVQALEVTLTHMSRLQNGVADKLAKWGVELPFMFEGAFILDCCLEQPIHFFIAWLYIMLFFF